MSITHNYASHLISLESITPNDADCQKWVAEILARSGFDVIDYNQNQVTNTLYTRQGARSGKHLLFLGHTDVVPAGPLDDWHTSPFVPEEKEGYLYGRGAADMKGAVAAMLSAFNAFVMHQPDYAGRLSLLLTSDEEGPAVDGVRIVVPALEQQRLLPDYCLVGEPSSMQQLGDTIRIGRRGSIHGAIRFLGVQGHTAYARSMDNPAHRALRALHAITTEAFDQGDKDFPPTLLHISNIQAGTGAANVTPGALDVRFNIRNSPASPAGQIRERIEMLLAQHDAGDYELDWVVSGEPFVTRQSGLIDAVTRSVELVNNVTPQQDTGGGTSDGRFFGAAGCQVVELGLVNETIHQVNESTLLTDLDRLHAIYYDCMRRLLA